MSTLQDGVAHAMTANAFTSVSLDPPLVLVCVDKGVRMHAAVLDCGYWAISVLAGDQQPIADRFARSGRDLYSQFDGIGTTEGPKTGCAVIQGAQDAGMESVLYESFHDCKHQLEKLLTKNNKHPAAA